MFAASKTASVSGGYQISRSLRFNSADTAYLSRTPASAGNRQTWTFSTWFKRGSTSANVTLFSGGTTGRLAVYINSSGQLISDLSGTGTYDQSTAVYRDPSAWYHFVWQFDTTQATAANRSRMYINGVQVTLTQSTTFTQNTNYEINNNVIQTIGTLSNSTSTYAFDGYQTETYFIDGTSLTPSSFGETNAQTGVWQPKAYSGTYGTNGFYLNFSDNSNTTAATLGKDYSGNGNNWTPNNFSVTAGAGNDSLVDSPTSYGTTDTGVGGEIRGNYCTWNPVLQADFWATPVGKQTLTNGNLDASGNGQAAFTTFEIPNNLKVYYEITWSSIGSEAAVLISAASRDTFELSYLSNGQKELTGNTRSSYGASWTNGDIIGVAIDRANNTATFYKNGTSQGAITHTFTTATVLGGIYGGSSSVNFGQRPFAYTAPSGFKALCTQNLPTPTIGATTATQAGKYFNTIIWTGDSANPRTFTGVGFQPDLVWAKGRSIATSHFLSDAVRGVTSSDTRTLATNNTTAETNQYSPNGGVTAFTSDGFTTSGSTNLNLNFSGQTFVAWNWKANGSGSTNTSGSITSTVSANTTSGFSVVTYTGTGNSGTVGHGLGAVPKMIIVKSRSNAIDWVVYHESMPTPRSYVLRLNLTDAALAVGDYWGSSGPTSTTFGLNLYGGNNTANATYVAYCFAEVAGFSKFGSYIGNGSTDGPFIYCGFRPAYVMFKNASVSGSWEVYDTTRNTYNTVDNYLLPNVSDAEGVATNRFDYLSNGVKVRNTGGSINGSGNTIIFMAFASNPFKYSLAR